VVHIIAPSYSYLQCPLLKGPCHEIFALRFSSSNNSIWAPDTRIKAFLLRIRLFSYEISWSTVSITPLTAKVILGYPPYFVQMLLLLDSNNLTMSDFIDILWTPPITGQRCQ
jgi:hypothetical protein